MQQKRYLENLIHHCSEHSFGQDAIEWAILHNWVRLTHHLATDTALIMIQYDAICTAYRQRVMELQQLAA